MDAQSGKDWQYADIKQPCVLAGMDGKLLRVNDAFCKLLGYRREELVGLTLRDLTPERWHGLDRDMVQNQALTLGFSEIYEKELRRKDGSCIPVELVLTLIGDKDGNPAELFAIIRDITERVEMQQELRRGRAEYQHLAEEYRALAENSPDILIRFDRHFRHIYANSAAARTVGLSHVQLMERTLFELSLPEELVEIWQQRIDSVFASGAPARLEDVMPGEEGESHFEYHLAPEYHQDGSVASVLVIGRDITERKRAETALLRAHEELEDRVAERTLNLQEALQEQESFSYTVSHDLRAPLRHINGYLSILAEDYGVLLPPEAQHLLERSCSASKRMGSLIDELLRLSRVSRTNLVRQTVDLTGIVLGICSSLKESAPEREVEFVIASGLKARGDASLLVQLITNLIDNAWKYSARAPAPRIEFGKEAVGNESAFYVRDNGVGFEMAYVDKLFGPFQRLHGPEYEGNGIGLATVKRIVERHRGRVWAESQPGQGATFYFTLP